MLIITIKVVPEDYEKKVEEVLKQYRKTAVLPGFRKGKTPMSLVVKKYRTSVLVDEVSKLLQDELYQYITKNKIRVLGSPMPVSKQDIDWEKDTTFDFNYEVGLAPEFKVNLTSKDKLTYYKIEVDEKLVDGYCADLAKRYGKMNSPNISVSGDLLFCKIEQLDLKGNLLSNGIVNEASVSMDYISDNRIKKQFIGVKKNDSFKVNVTEAFTNQSDLAAMLNIDHKKLQDLQAKDFLFTVKNINRLEPAKLDKDLFNKIYGEGVVKTIKSFRNKIKQEAEKNFLTESDKMLKNDVVNYLLDKIQLKLPDEFLKRWLVHSSEKPITISQVDSEYDLYSKSLKWQLIENEILSTYNVKVDEDDALLHTKKLISIQMKQYGQSNPEDKQLDEIANNILKNQDEKKKVYDQLFDEKTMEIYKDKFKLSEKTISYNDFVKLASEK